MGSQNTGDGPKISRRMGKQVELASTHFVHVTMVLTKNVTAVGTRHVHTPTAALGERIALGALTHEVTTRSFDQPRVGICG